MCQDELDGASSWQYCEKIKSKLLGLFFLARSSSRSPSIAFFSQNEVSLVNLRLQYTNIR